MDWGQVCVNMRRLKHKLRIHYTYKALIKPDRVP